MGTKPWRAMCGKESFFLVALILINMDDDDLPGPVNSNIVKKYFQSI
jgi:hypothetical protein